MCSGKLGLSTHIVLLSLPPRGTETCYVNQFCLPEPVTTSWYSWTLTAWSQIWHDNPISGDPASLGPLPSQDTSVHLPRVEALSNVLGF
ncbi:hypothetical protein BD310DRAFT_916407 [Dichomitus squalens]|uniref:Uncharacterized protein n=1 Tax=Dichomitus squalens TaxID=114155 RepID=A0A4Q9Q8D9_9APHY|nr:hypothetical protein BD310DRAFT_916407 [Dichomitus squalens]